MVANPGNQTKCRYSVLYILKDKTGLLLSIYTCPVLFCPVLSCPTFTQVTEPNYRVNYSSPCKPPSHQHQKPKPEPEPESGRKSEPRDFRASKRVSLHTPPIGTVLYCTYSLLTLATDPTSVTCFNSTPYLQAPNFQTRTTTRHETNQPHGFTRPETEKKERKKKKKKKRKEKKRKEKKDKKRQIITTDTYTYLLTDLLTPPPPLNLFFF